MTTELYDNVRKNLFGDGHQNAFVRLLYDRSAIRGPIQGTPEEFAQILYELTQGELDKRNETVSYETITTGNKSILKFHDGSLFRVVKTKSQLGGPLIVVTPHLPSMDDLLEAREKSIARLASEALMIEDAYKRVAEEYARGEVKRVAKRAVEEHRRSRESRLDAIVEFIEKAKSGEMIMVRGLQNIAGLVNLGFVPNLVDNPDNWIDAEDFPGLRYSYTKSGNEVLLTGRERFRPIEELNRLEFLFQVNRNDDDPSAFKRMSQKFRGFERDGSPYSLQEFQSDLIALVKYPEELKGRTEEDLGLMADEVEHVIDQRQVLDSGILPYEAVFKKDTTTIVAFIRENSVPAREIRKALDYFEYTGMIDLKYKAVLYQQLMGASREQTGAAPHGADMLHDKRIKEIVAEVLKNIPKERLTRLSITIALTPYVNELGLGKIVKIRERILQLKEMVHDQ